MNEIKAIDAAQLEAIYAAEDEKKNKKKERGNFKVGDTVKVHFKIVEGVGKDGKPNERIQVYEGLVIAMKNAQLGQTFTVRKISYGVGVERVFPLHSPRVAKVEVMRPGRVRRAKLYYIREKIGKGAKIKELIIKKSAKQAAAAAVESPKAETKA